MPRSGGLPPQRQLHLVRSQPRPGLSQSVYEEAGGYDATRDVLDDQDLMCRMYQLTDFHLIDECLYLQRMHKANTQREAEINARIQVETVALYDRYIEPNALAWANRRGLTWSSWDPLR